MEQSKKKRGILGTVMVAVLSAALMGISAAQLFVPAIELVYICYFICGAAIAAGIILIVRYFVTDAFRNINEYGFSEGMLLIILGVCGTIRAESLAGAFLTILGIALLLSGIVKLQYAMDLKRMRDVMWFFVFFISMLVLTASVLVILQIFTEKAWFETALWYTMLSDGGISLLVLIYTVIRVKLFMKKEEKEKQKAAAEDGREGRTEAAEGSAPEQSPQNLPEEPDTGKDVLQETLDEVDAELQQGGDADDVQ